MTLLPAAIAPSARVSSGRHSVTPSGEPANAWQDHCKRLLRQARLKPTHQRVALGALLFSHGNRHVTAEMLHAEAIGAKIPVSLATVYNTLNQLTEVGLLRRIAVAGAQSFFDTDVSEHHHFFIEEENALLDIPLTEPLLGALPPPPEGFEIARFTLVVRLRRRPS